MNRYTIAAAITPMHFFECRSRLYRYIIILTLKSDNLTLNLSSNSFKINSQLGLLHIETIALKPPKSIGSKIMKDILTTLDCSWF